VRSRLSVLRVLSPPHEDGARDELEVVLVVVGIAVLAYLMSNLQIFVNRRSNKKRQ
jgi:hypothetical protein